MSRGTARSATPAKVDTYTDAHGVVHVAVHALTFCRLWIPSDPSGAMPGWPAPPKLDWVPGIVNCLACLAGRV